MHRVRPRVDVGRKNVLVAAIILASVVLLVAEPCWALKIVHWNLLNYSSGRETQFKTVLNAIQADVLVCQEVNNESAANTFLSSVLNATGGPGGYSMATFANGGDTSNALFYRAASITYGGSGDHTTLATSPRLTDRWKLGLTGGSVYFYVYSMHLKAGTEASDLASRLAQCTIVRNDANLFPTGTAFIYAGDFNLQSSSESSYQKLVGSQTDNDGRGFDPINSPGDWYSNSSFSCIHTQSPHNNNTGAPPGATGGGMDDRFDFMLISAALQDGLGLDYVTGTYKAYGNDCLHFNNDINDPPTIPEGQTIADALHGASDHLPVVMQLTATPCLQVPSSLGFGTVIVGATGSATERNLQVQNCASPPALDLQYTFSTVPNGYSAPGGTGPFTLTAGQSRQHTIALVTSTPGFYNGFLVITNNAGNPKSVNLYNGVVKAHAVPSASGSSQVLTAPLDFGNHSPGGFADQTAYAYNLGYVTLQAPLEVYAYNIAGQDASKFSLVGFSPTNVTDTPAAFTVHFDDSGAAAGAYSAALQFSTRDDSTLPGWANRPTLTFNLTASIGIKGDMNSSGSVEVGDISGFVAVLLDPAGATASQRWLADMSGDSLDDGRDVQPFVSALLAAP